MQHAALTQKINRQAGYKRMYSPGSVNLDGPHYSFRPSAFGIQKGGKKPRFQWAPSFKGRGGRGGFKPAQGGFGRGQPRAGLMSAQCMSNSTCIGTRVVPFTGRDQDGNGGNPLLQEAAPGMVAAERTEGGARHPDQRRASGKEPAKQPNRSPPLSFAQGGAASKTNFLLEYYQAGR